MRTDYETKKAGRKITTELRKAADEAGPRAVIIGIAGYLRGQLAGRSKRQHGSLRRGLPETSPEAQVRAKEIQMLRRAHFAAGELDDLYKKREGNE